MQSAPRTLRIRALRERKAVTKTASTTAASPESNSPHLERCADGLYLVAGDVRLRGDFSSLASRVAPARISSELLVKACKVKGANTPPTAIDATAGLGEDSFVLAAAGFSVVMCERDPMIAALLADALDRARADERTAHIAARMTLAEADSIAYMNSAAAQDQTVDVVFLDPMFPAKRKSALTNKKLQLIRALESPCTEGVELLNAARAIAAKKVVVKRAVKAPTLTDAKPASSIAGKTIRYDIYPPLAR